ncbi:MAG: indole-3-glycerol phosphate synthase TrpC [Candidatus Methylacidiphilales bacterium]
MKSDRLAEIVRHKQLEVEALRPLEAELRRAALLRNDFRGFRRVLHQPGTATLIAEVKKASPSAGVIAADFDPVRRAVEYEAAGADALSVLTDEKFFQGSLDYLIRVREAVDLPVLRKDFMVEPVQIYQAVAYGADAVLLIVAALEPDALQRMFDCARQFPVDILVEVHDLEEMDAALDLGADMIGINNRNLKTFHVDLATTEQLAEEIPSDCLGITESGIQTAADVSFCRSQGIDCFLIGETLMRSGNVDATIKELMGRL